VSGAGEVEPRGRFDEQCRAEEGEEGEFYRRQLTDRIYVLLYVYRAGKSLAACGIEPAA
jgi:hypothetical protein